MRNYLCFSEVLVCNEIYPDRSFRGRDIDEKRSTSNIAYTSATIGKRMSLKYRSKKVFKPYLDQSLAEN